VCREPLTTDGSTQTDDLLLQKAEQYDKVLEKLKRQQEDFLKVED
jgi:hypothetical protein